jgi:hypothetical protein
MSNSQTFTVVTSDELVGPAILHDTDEFIFRIERIFYHHRLTMSKQAEKLKREREALSKNENCTEA